MKCMKEWEKEKIKSTNQWIEACFRPKSWWVERFLRRKGVWVEREEKRIEIFEWRANRVETQVCIETGISIDQEGLKN